MQVKKCKKVKSTMKKDFKQFFLENVGQSTTKQCDFQQLDGQTQDLESDQQPNDFYIQDQQQQLPSIKQKQFWNGLIGPSQIPQPSSAQINYQYQCIFSSGYNSLGRDNIILIEADVCKAVGCLLLYKGHLLHKHNYVISTMSYSKERKQLLTGSEGKRQQLILWKLQQGILNFNKKFLVGAKSQTIYAVQFFGSEYLLAIQKFSLHASSMIHCFDRKSNKKLNIKAGRFYDLEQTSDERLFIANDNGISQLKVEIKAEQKQLNLKLIQQNDSITCLFPFNLDQDQTQSKFQIIYGDKEGNISLLFGKNTKKIHNGWVFEIKSYKTKDKQMFFTVGAIDCQITLLQFIQNKIIILKKFTLTGYVRSMYILNEQLLLGYRNGKIQKYNILKTIHQPQIINCRIDVNYSLGSFSSRQQKKQFFIQDKQSFANYYSNSISKHMLIWNHNENKQPIRYSLREYPQSLSILNNIIAYSYDIYQQDQQQQNKSSTINSNFSKIFTQKKQKSKFIKSVLVVEDFIDNKLIKKVSLDKLTSKCTKTLINQQNIIMGFQNGQLILVSIHQDDNQKIKYFQHKHKQFITQIIFSQDLSRIKTISTSQIYYWHLKNNQIINLKPSQAKEILWQSIGKFSWENKAIWDKTDLIQDITSIWAHEQILMNKTSKTQIQSFKKRIIGVNTYDGRLKLYNSPPNASKFQQIKFYDKEVMAMIDLQSSQNLRFWVIFQAIVLLLQLK